MVRPKGVTLVAILTIIGGLLALSIGLFFLLDSGFLIRYTGMPNFIGSIAPKVETLGFSVALLDFIMAYGLLRLANWGRVLTIISTAIFLVLAVLGAARAVLRSDVFLIPQGMQVVTIVVDVTILWYLLRARVKGVFSRAPRVPEPPTAPGTPAASVK